MKVITFSRYFPKGHSKQGTPTRFVEKILNGISNYDRLSDLYWQKWHTIRKGNRWKVGDIFSARYWTDKPYRSKQKEFAQLEVKKIWDFTFNGHSFSINGEKYFGDTESDFELLEEIAKNDGLSRHDFVEWFKVQTKNNYGFAGQIISWNENLEYAE